MKITEVRCAGLRGATPEGGWSNELQPEDCVHTLVAVHTDAGLVGLGLNVKVSVAAGIKQSTIEQVVKAGPNIVVVGGAITGAKAPDVAAREIRDLVNAASGEGGGGLFGWLKKLFS